MAASGEDEAFPNGATRLYGILGAPVVQVRAPGPVTARLRAAGANAILVPIEVAPAELATVFAALKRVGNFDGMVVTVPHKVAMAGLIDSCSARARLVGAVNLVRRDAEGRWRGEIGDGVGLVRGLRAGGFNPAGQSALVVGCGGAGAAVAVELASAGAQLKLFDVRADRAGALAARLRAAGYPAEALGEADPDGAALVVNATPLGMHPEDPLPLDEALLRPEMLVAEVVMKPPVTPLLWRAQAHGCRIQLGEVVMLQQLEAMVGFFLRGEPL